MNLFQVLKKQRRLIIIQANLKKNRLHILKYYVFRTEFVRSVISEISAILVFFFFCHNDRQWVNSVLTLFVYNNCVNVSKMIKNKPRKGNVSTLLLIFLYFVANLQMCVYKTTNQGDFKLNDSILCQVILNGVHLHIKVSI